LYFVTKNTRNHVCFFCFLFLHHFNREASDVHVNKKKKKKNDTPKKTITVIYNVYKGFTGPFLSFC